MLKFEKNDYTIEEVTLCGETIRFRAFRDLIYVEKPVNEEFQKMNLFVPECYYEGASLHGYDLGSAPVFMPNTVGGYMPGPADEPGTNPFLQGRPNTIFRALQHGYVGHPRQSAAECRRGQMAGTTEKHHPAWLIIKQPCDISTSSRMSCLAMRAKLSPMERVPEVRCHP